MTPYDQLEPIEKASVDELRALQLERLRWSLAHAYENVPHYRRKFDDHGVHPDDLKGLADLARFPFTTKQDLRENYHIFCSAVVYPVIPKGMILLRLIPTAVHTKADIDETIKAFGEVAKKLKIGRAHV